MKIKDLKVKVMELGLEDCEFLTNAVIKIGDKKYNSEEIAVDYFEDRGWRVIKPVRDFDLFKKSLSKIYNKHKDKNLKVLCGRIKQLSGAYDSKRGKRFLFPAVLGIPDLFMYKEWIEDENGNMVYHPVYRFVEVKTKDCNVSYNQIRWALNWGIPEIYYMYIIKED